jgi:hypothetical protein
MCGLIVVDEGVAGHSGNFGCMLPSSAKESKCAINSLVGCKLKA